MWDPEVYGRYAAERGRPFHELVARVGARSPRYVVDLGCGTGELTATLCDRWPGARVHGVDSSPEMIAKAPPGPTFETADVRDWRPQRPVDVIISNALLQWIPEHPDLLRRWRDHLAEGGWLAFQIPGNFHAPSHAVVRELCRTTWREELGDVPQGAPVAGLVEYVDLLTGLGLVVDGWETTYVHILPGEDPVLGWIKGTALRPLLDRLPAERHDAFLADCARALREAYPPKPYGTPFPFRRLFLAAQNPA
ncbi:trans-aconitate 2-methyltransferase [Microbispora sp. H11081]|uniref:trans-aconitate 2-methyltransferase n=1 Tax=Microbispora sp. H11081 TaxID=2729107 RepID=UPI0014729CAC|nr:trans-aconitate 2-methyltransferase [Microbispora sp. H11081]